MLKTVGLQPEWHYPLIVRVLLKGQLYYHAKVIACTVEHPWFTVPLVQKILRIGTVEEWKQTNLRDIARTRAALAAEIKRIGVHSELDPVGFFVSVWPTHGQIIFARERLRVPQLEFAQSA